MLGFGFGGAREGVVEEKGRREEGRVWRSEVRSAWRRRAGLDAMVGCENAREAGGVRGWDEGSALNAVVFLVRRVVVHGSGRRLRCEILSD